MVDELHILIWNRTEKSLAIALSGVRRGSRERNGEGDIANVQYNQYNPSWNFHMNPHIQW
jgi:hypothetical protein